ncbi:MAG: cyclic nucleotide-binding domain-containing protein [Magnetococcales bacterium]|nr:cyclic nucleotide-binding domain-containing protein [Magnetococcales bacterium]
MRQIEDVDRDKILDALDELEFFQHFSLYEKKRITGMHAHFFVYDAEELMIEEGTTDTAFLILVTGKAVVLKAGVEQPLARIGPGDFVGEMAFLTSMARTTTVQAESQTLAIRVDQELLARLGAEIREKIKDRIIRKLVDRVAELTRRLS